MKISNTLKILTLLIIIIIVSNCSDEDCITQEEKTPPIVVTTYPDDGDTAIATDTFLTVTFDQRMDSTSISTGSFTLEGPRGIVNTTVMFDGDSTITYTPYEILAGHSVYTAHIDEGVRGIDGNRMDVPYAWSFTTDVTNIWLYADIEYTIRDSDNNGTADELVGGGPPGRFLQSGVNSQQTDRAIFEFPLEQIVHNVVIDAVGFMNIEQSSSPYGEAHFEVWGFIGNGTAEISDWDKGSLLLTIDSIFFQENATFALPILDLLNMALDSSATHIGIRIEITGEPVVEITNSILGSDDENPRIIVRY